MKKCISLLIVILLVTLCGCNSTPSKPPENVVAAPVPQTTETPPTTTEPATTPEPTVTTEPSTPVTTPAKPAVEVEWQTLTYQWEDNNGYQFEATIKISPWINTKNTDYVTTAWNEVGSGKTLPSDDSKSWGNAPSSDDYYRPVDNATDVYYCIGNVTIKNLTTGWDITASAPVT